ncbi:unnamed protein product [Cercospora beticola]|nr:unnamed protein product [Cercospora beticola]
MVDEQANAQPIYPLVSPFTQHIWLHDGSLKRSCQAKADIRLSIAKTASETAQLINSKSGVQPAVYVVQYEHWHHDGIAQTNRLFLLYWTYRADSHSHEDCCSTRIAEIL